MSSQGGGHFFITLDLARYNFRALVDPCIRHRFKPGYRSHNIFTTTLEQQDAIRFLFAHNLKAPIGAKCINDIIIDVRRRGHNKLDPSP